MPAPWEIREMDNKLKLPDEQGHFGPYGGKFVPETLMPALGELESAYVQACADPNFQQQFHALCCDYAGRPTPLYHAQKLSEKMGGAQIFLKREDLLHTVPIKSTMPWGKACWPFAWVNAAL